MIIWFQLKLAVDTVGTAVKDHPWAIVGVVDATTKLVDSVDSSLRVWVGMLLYATTFALMKEPRGNYHHVIKLVIEI